MAMKATRNRDLLVVIRPSWPKGTRKSKRDAQVNKKAQEGCPRRTRKPNVRGMPKGTRKREGCPSEQESERDAQVKVALL